MTGPGPRALALLERQILYGLTRTGEGPAGLASIRDWLAEDFQADASGRQITEAVSWLARLGLVTRHPNGTVVITDPGRRELDTVAVGIGIAQLSAVIAALGDAIDYRDGDYDPDECADCRRLGSRCDDHLHDLALANRYRLVLDQLREATT